MTRQSSRRAEHVQPDKPAPGDNAGAAPPAPSADAAPVSQRRMAWHWRLVLFLWTTSFFFLLVYELLSALFRMF